MRLGFALSGEYAEMDIGVKANLGKAEKDSYFYLWYFLSLGMFSRRPQQGGGFLTKPIGNTLDKGVYILESGDVFLF